jgi:uncharacterized membrane protein
MKDKVKKKNYVWRYGFAVIIIFSGLILSYLNIDNNFLGFSSVGTWLIYVGFIMLAIITLQLKTNKKRIVDERMQGISTKAVWITFLAIIITSFIIMIIDGIKPITVPYAYFMSYFTCGIILLYAISYKILLRYN